MKKAFVWDPIMRSSARKYDPCISVKEGRCQIQCKDCRITLIADRFLGEEFQREILGKLGKSRGRYPYVIIADTLGCNLRCWFCYAYKFWDKKSAEENNCLISYLSPKELAKQFGCKIKKLSNFKKLVSVARKKESTDSQCRGAVRHLKMKLPLMRIRISGGEPIFSNKETIINPIYKNDLIKSTMKYWLIFFEELDKIIGELKKKDKLHIINKSEVKNREWKTDLPFPTCLAEKRGRLNIRFDTNGILFGRKEITKNFIGGLFKLFKRNKLKNLFIEIDYSLKGPTPIEYNWSQRKDLPVDPKKINFDFNLREHPQLSGYFNIVNIINEYVSKDNEFCNCVGITVERGINHHIPYKTYLNCENSLDWEKFSHKTGIQFSVVDNPIEMFNWRNWRPKTCFIQNGASIKIIAGRRTFDLNDNPDINKFDEFRRKYYPNCYFVIYPIVNKIILKRVYRKKEIKLTKKLKIPLARRNFWILTGSEKNLEIGLKNDIWGVKKKFKNLWDNLKIDDIVFFYCTKPVSGIIGSGRVISKHVDEKPFWPDEPPQKKSKYLLRIAFKKLFILPKKQWSTEKMRISDLGIEYYHGLNFVKPGEMREKLLKRIQKRFEIEI